MIKGLSCLRRRPQSLEEAWIVPTQVREDELSQAAVVALLDRHTKRVCQRLALLERLREIAHVNLCLSLLSLGLDRIAHGCPRATRQRW